MLIVKKTTLRDIKGFKKENKSPKGIRVTNLRDLKSLREEAEDLKRQTYLEKFGKIKNHILDEEIADRELDDFY